MANNDILTTQEAADMLGAHIETIRRLARKGGLPAFKIGKDWRFSRTALNQWASGQQQERQQQPTVLLIDDDPSITKLIGQLLTPLGCSVIAAATGKEGLDITAQQPVDLVLLDLHMPVMDGATFIANFRDQHKETPVIIVTGYPDSEMMTEAMRFGPLLLIQKPVDKQSLLSAAKLALKGHYTGGEEGASDSV